MNLVEYRYLHKPFQYHHLLFLFRLHHLPTLWSLKDQNSLIDFIEQSQQNMNIYIHYPYLNKYGKIPYFPCVLLSHRSLDFNLQIKRLKVDGGKIVLVEARMGQKTIICSKGGDNGLYIKLSLKSFI